MRVPPAAALAVTFGATMLEEFYFSLNFSDLACAQAPQVAGARAECAAPAGELRQTPPPALRAFSGQRGPMGRQAPDPGPWRAAAPGLDAAQGVPVASVAAGAPAAGAGLQAGDVIAQCDGEEIVEPRRLALTVATSAPGETVTTAVRRDGAPRDIEVTVAQQPGMTPAAAPDDDAAPQEASQEAPPGVATAAPTPAPRQSPGAPTDCDGVIVTGMRQGSPADTAGSNRGDVFVAAGRAPACRPEAPRDAVAEADGAPQVRVPRAAGYAFLAAPLGQT